jgi:hypothetical protein
VARHAGGGVSGIVRGILDEEIALTPGNFFPCPCRYRLRGIVRSSPASTDRCAFLTLRPAVANIGVASALLPCVRYAPLRGRCVAG